MNILIFSWRGPGHPHAGGAEYSTSQHAKAWIKAGHQVTLFTSSFDGAKSEETIGGIKIIRRGRQIFSVHLMAVFWYLFDRHDKFDIVLDEVHGLPFFTPLFVRAPKLVFIHEVAKEVWRLNPWPSPFNLLPAVVGPLLEPLIFKFFYKKIKFMTVSQSTRDDLMEWDIPRENITVVYNGFNHPNYQTGKKETMNTVIYLGALSKDKGIEDALVVFKRLAESSTNSQFWIVGKGEGHYLEFLKKRVKSLGIERITKFFGFVTDREKYKLLSKAHVLINPSIREGWGFVVIEAASVGTPTVGYNVAGLKDSIIDGKTGLLSEPNPESLTEKISYLLSNEAVYSRFCENGKRWSREFSWSESASQSLKLLEKVSKNT
ncbi:glycosyltransferase family 4 protein [Candidatus Daviesbacteria bacterium]|nr:glycosyltransferase family 4 protein [Candidatus Daviesbacteria bacterium]